MNTSDSTPRNTTPQRRRPAPAGALNLLVLAATMLFANSAPAALMLGDSENGKAIHDAKCMGCHVAQFKDGSKVYTRANHTVNSIEGLLKRVEFCSKQTGANLSDKEINDVVKYLNESFYKFKQ